MVTALRAVPGDGELLGGRSGDRERPALPGSRSPAPPRIPFLRETGLGTRRPRGRFYIRLRVAAT